MRRPSSVRTVPAAWPCDTSTRRSLAALSNACRVAAGSASRFASKMSVGRLVCTSCSLWTRTRTRCRYTGTRRGLPAIECGDGPETCDFPPFIRILRRTKSADSDASKTIAGMDVGRVLLDPALRGLPKLPASNRQQAFGLLIGDVATGRATTWPHGLLMKQQPSNAVELWPAAPVPIPSVPRNRPAPRTGQPPRD